MKNEPVMIGAGSVTALIVAFAAVAMRQGWIVLTPEQATAWGEFIRLLVPFLFAAAPLLIGWRVRSRVTPVSRPRDNLGRRLLPEVVTPIGDDDGTP